MKNIICIVARTNSTRLPQKVLKKIGDRMLIEHLIDRMKLSVEFDEIYICTSSHKDDSILIDIAKENEVKYVAGSELAVIERLLDAAEKSGAKNLVRVTGDNPLTDPFILDDVLKDHIKKDADYSLMTFLPRGSTGDVIRVEALKKLYGMMDPNESQYLGIYINKPKEFECNFIFPPKEMFNPYINISVDMPNEFEDVTELINNLGIEKETSEYVKYAQSQKICSFPKEKLIKVSETKSMKYGDYIEWQVKKVKGEAV